MKKYLISEIKKYLKTKEVQKVAGKSTNYEDVFMKIDGIIEEFHAGGSKDFNFIEKIIDEVSNFPAEKKDESGFVFLVSLTFSILGFGASISPEYLRGAIIVGTVIVFFLYKTIYGKIPGSIVVMQEYKIYKLIELKEQENNVAEGLYSKKRLSQRSKIKHSRRIKSM